MVSGGRHGESVGVSVTLFRCATLKRDASASLEARLLRLRRAMTLVLLSSGQFELRAREHYGRRWLWHRPSVFRFVL